MMRCPVCARPSAPREANSAFPFCGSHCKMVDLGRWFDESYRVASSDEGESGGAGGDPSPIAAKDEE